MVCCRDQYKKVVKSILNEINKELAECDITKEYCNYEDKEK